MIGQERGRCWHYNATSDWRNERIPFLWLFSEKCTDHISVGASPQALGIYRFTANGTVGYAGHTATEDRATVGTDPSAVAAPYGTGGILRGVACFVAAGGPKATNPRAVARSFRCPRRDRPCPGTLSGEEPQNLKSELASPASVIQNPKSKI